MEFRKRAAWALLSPKTRAPGSASGRVPLRSDPCPRFALRVNSSAFRQRL